MLTDASGARAPFSLCEPSPRMSMYTDDRFGDPRGLLDRPSPAVHARRLTGEILTHLNKARVAGSARPLPPQSQCCQCSRAMAQEMKILPIPTLRLGGRGAAEMTSPCLRRRRPLPLHPFQNFTNTITNTTIIININIFIIIALHKQPHTHTPSFPSAAPQGRCRSSGGPSWHTVPAHRCRVHATTARADAGKSGGATSDKGQNFTRRKSSGPHRSRCKNQWRATTRRTCVD